MIQFYRFQLIIYINNLYKLIIVNLLNYYFNSFEIYINIPLLPFVIIKIDKLLYQKLKSHCLIYKIII